MAMQKAVEKFGENIRWTAQPKDQKQAEQTVYVGDVIQGWYQNKKTDVGQNNSNVYEIILVDGRLVSIWGSGVLDGKFAMIPEGAEVRITYKGIQQPKRPGGRAYQDFEVEFDKDSRKPANLVPATAPAAGNPLAGVTAAPAAAANQDFTPGPQGVPSEIPGY